MKNNDKKIGEQSFNMYQKYYSDDKFIAKIIDIAGNAGCKIVYAALLLFYAMKSDEISLSDKSIIVGVLGYLILPLDLIPDYIPFMGLTDDFTALSFAVSKIKDSITPEIRSQADGKMKEWFGTFDDDTFDSLMK